MRNEEARRPFWIVGFHHVSYSNPLTSGGQFRQTVPQTGGVTAFLQAPAEGVWRQGDQCSNDEIVIFEVMTEEIDLRALRTRRADLERRFRQHEVIIRYSSIGVV
ncbi:hypothetical protein [Mesorhizobium sp. M0968]|uniref:hypothetical protein n=1 Tax=Mesorhizobium sp. M0968 TaxID=2957037 RepID=UPI00333D161C